MCAILSMGLVLLLQRNNSTADLEDSAVEHTLILSVEAMDKNLTIEEQYYIRELQSLIMQDCLEIVYNNADTKKSIIDKLSEYQYTDFDASVDTPTYENFNNGERMVALKLSGINQERTVLILNTYKDVMDYVCRTNWPDFYVDSINNLQVDTTDDITTNVSSFMTIRNILIVFAGIFIGILVIGILVLYDDKIYTLNEMNRLYDFIDFGKIGNDTLNLGVLKNYLKNEEICSLVVLGEFEGLDRVLAAYLPEVKLNLLSKQEYLNYFGEENDVLVLITLGKEQKKDVDKLISMSDLTGRKLIGCVFAD